MASPGLTGKKNDSLKRTTGESSEEDDKTDNVKKAKTETSLKISSSSPSTSSSSNNKGLMKIKLNQPAATKKKEPEILKKASVFGESSDEDEVEEMPPEAKMRMKNIGRDTQTSAGPNSFGKTRQGFCDSSKMLERQLNKALNND